MIVDTEPLLALARRIAEATAPKPRRTKTSRQQRHAVWKRAGSACEGCGARDRLAVHHVVPASKGGTNRPGNLKLYCPACERRDHLKWGIVS